MKCPRCGKEIKGLPCDECGFPLNQKKPMRIIQRKSTKRVCKKQA